MKPEPLFIEQPYVFDVQFKTRFVRVMRDGIKHEYKNGDLTNAL